METQTMKPLHFLIATMPIQGHIAPARQLASLLARTTGGAVTISTPISAHRRLFPSSDDSEVEDGPVTYIPYSDGYDDGFDPATDDPTEYGRRTKAAGSKTLSAALQSLAGRDLPVHCMIHTLFMSWASEVAREHRVPSVLYWVQGATSLSISYHHLHGHGNTTTSEPANASPSSVEFPGLPTSLDVGDLPSLLTISKLEDPFFPLSVMYREMFESLHGVPKQRVLVNSFDALEAAALAEVGKFLQVFAIGPVLPLSRTGTEDVKRNSAAASLFKEDAKAYMEWMDAKPSKSVIYVSFGSLAVLKKKQMEEILRGLKESRRPFLWAARADQSGQRPEERAEMEAEAHGGAAGNGMMVEWCNQWEVLSHPATGCFVTHCGWNSTSESLACGVPTVGVPLLMDQKLNARLMEKEWGAGVRCELNGEGVLEGEELAKCLEIVMGEGGVELRRRAAEWRDRAREASGDGGSSDRSLRAFVEAIVAVACK